MRNLRFLARKTGGVFQFVFMHIIYNEATNLKWERSSGYHILHIRTSDRRQVKSNTFPQMIGIAISKQQY